jgi:hypothetical protein
MPDSAELFCLWDLYKILRARVTPDGEEFIPLTVKAYP